MRLSLSLETLSLLTLMRSLYASHAQAEDGFQVVTASLLQAVYPLDQVRRSLWCHRDSLCLSREANSLESNSLDPLLSLFWHCNRISCVESKSLHLFLFGLAPQQASAQTDTAEEAIGILHALTMDRDIRQLASGLPGILDAVEKVLQGGALSVDTLSVSLSLLISLLISLDLLISPS